MFDDDDGAIGWTVAQPGEHLILNVGEVYFGRAAASVRTLLGSCVALTLWHPRMALAGMCHFMLPERVRAHAPADGRFGDDAVDMLASALARAGTYPVDYVAHLYGGAATLHAPHSTSVLSVGAQNIAQGLALMARHGFNVHASDVGDRWPRTVRLWCADGRVDVQRGAWAPFSAPALPAPISSSFALKTAV